MSLSTSKYLREKIYLSSFRFIHKSGWKIIQLFVEILTVSIYRSQSSRRHSTWSTGGDATKRNFMALWQKLTNRKSQMRNHWLTGLSTVENRTAYSSPEFLHMWCIWIVIHVKYVRELARLKKKETEFLWPLLQTINFNFEPAMKINWSTNTSQDLNEQFTWAVIQSYDTGRPLLIVLVKEAYYAPSIAQFFFSKFSLKWGPFYNIVIYWSVTKFSLFRNVIRRNIFLFRHP